MNETVCHPGEPITLPGPRGAQQARRARRRGEATR